MKLSQFTIILLFIGTFFTTSCKKECMDHSIVVDAGNDQTVQLSTTTVALNGTVKSGLTANTTYLWTVVSGPNIPSFANNNAASTTISGLVAGTYVFQFQATNSYGETGIDTTSLVVSSGPQTITLQPADNPNEGVINVHAPDQWLVTDQLYIEAWTDLGAPFTGRVAIKFDYSSIPAGATITSAQLYLYSAPAPENGDKINAQQGPTNAFYIQRILSSWTLPNPFTWNSQPSATTVNQVLVPQAASSSQNVTADVTALVQDMFTNGNNGFYMRLQNEVIYNVRQFVSSNDNVNTSLRPKLVITYQ